MEPGIIRLDAFLLTFHRTVHVLTEHPVGLSGQGVFGDRFSHIEKLVPASINRKSFKTGGLLWQWSIKTGSTVLIQIGLIHYATALT